MFSLLKMRGAWKMNERNPKLKSWKIYAYALAVFGFIMLVNMNSSFTNFYLTDVAAIPVGMIATILLINRIGDMFLVPICGSIMEKSNMKWGKYRSWLIIGAPLLAIFYTLIYTNLNLSPIAKAVFFTVSYLLAHVFVNFIYGALYALIPLMAKSNHERSVISARRMQFTAIGQILAGYITMPMLLYFTGNGATVPGSKGFVITTGIFAVIMALMFAFAFYATKDFDIPSVENIQTKQKSTITNKELAKMTFDNPNLLAMIASETFLRVAHFGLLGVTAYYFIYVLNDIKSIALFFGNLGIIQFVGSTLFSRISARFDKRNLYLVGLSIMVLCQVVGWLVIDSSLMFTVIIGGSYIGYAMSLSASPAMFADATDYSELKYGKQGKGFLMSMANMPPKIALIITGTLTGWVLTGIGYEKGIASTPEIVSGIRNLTHFMPGIACMLAIGVILAFNKLNMKKVQEIQLEIAQKNQKSA